MGPSARDAVADGEDQTGETPLLAVLESWTEAVVDERGLTPVRRDVSSMVTLLTRHLPWVCEREWVRDFEEEIRELLKVTQKITMTEPVRQMLRGVTCPSCSMLSLVRYHPGDWAAECLNCPSQRFDERDFKSLVMAQARGLERVNP
ncbi:hypothetical protein ACFO9E_18275 [Streptomyces maoxianensis]|uniref:Uncharacterized protein n=1 Tax=Streptomyces maoxianensis TaxID=1459942 RepID=A0ABV9G618_9ACTN